MTPITPDRRAELRRLHTLTANENIDPFVGLHAAGECHRALPAILDALDAAETRIAKIRAWAEEHAVDYVAAVGAAAVTVLDILEDGHE